MDKINMQGINHLCTVYFIKRGFPVYSLIILIQSQVCMLKLSIDVRLTAVGDLRGTELARGVGILSNPSTNPLQICKIALYH